MANLLASEYSGWYDRLNQIRTKHRVANITVKTVSSNTPAYSSQMSQVQIDVNDTKNSERHLKNASINTTIPDISQGNRVLLNTRNTLDGILTAMYNVCHYDSSDYSGRDDHDGTYHGSCDSHRSDNSSDRTGCHSYNGHQSDYYECGSSDDPARFE